MVNLSQWLPFPGLRCWPVLPPRTSIYHDLEDSSPKSGLNYPPRLTESRTAPFFLLLPNPRFFSPPSPPQKILSTDNSAEEASPAQTASQYLRLSNTGGQPSSLSLIQPEGLPPIRINTAILFRGISLEQVLHWSNNLHVRWITCLLINDTIDTSTSEIHFL